MSVLKKKHIVILGLGHNGGGISSAKFAQYCEASHILISDLQSEKNLEPAIEQISSVINAPNVEIETGKHSIEKILQADIVIKNPAIPRNNPIIRTCIERGIAIETDISLFLQELILINNNNSKQKNVIAITGTKGKSSMSTAIHKWNTLQGIQSMLAGNITRSPLEYIMNNEIYDIDTCVLELSSFQLGDILYTQGYNSLYHPITLALLTNIMPDHQNYYASMEDYIQDKFTLFHNVSNTSYKILPYDKNLYVQKSSSHLMSNVLWHSNHPLPKDTLGIWHNDEYVFIRMKKDNSEILFSRNAIPKTIPLQNIMIFALTCRVQNIPIPQTIQEWQEIFSIAHRKEYVGKYMDRFFYNDSAATIPQAMNIASFQSMPTQHVLVIAGGTDKNLSPIDFITACESLPQSALTLYLLEGTYTDKILEYIKSNAITIKIAGTFCSLQEAIQTTMQESIPNDVIALCPGCASFGMFINEFHRGDVFKNIVSSL